ncbi:hypothetical protein [Tabrizicola fusiformis]|uniref:hypothetical protein n=1 Tax=Tabrizicola sp. SY72 TaxID=2741673 RepID=UPI00157194D4|nr:hypothetical protein [Tabrizicola sp. SY72]NTT87521.1 hypothetical protein [Tabrizicola sp. SY72]
MPVILSVIAAAGAVLWWMYRARAAGQVAQDLAGAASDVLNAARRFGFQRRANLHPVESIDKPELAVGAIGLAFLELDGLPSQEQQQALTRSLARHMVIPVAQAEEILILGRWLIGECGGPLPAIERLAKRLFRLNGAASVEPLLSVLKEVAVAGGQGGLSDRQKGAIEDIARLMRLR